MGDLGTSTHMVVLNDDLFDQIEFDAARTGDHRRAALRMNHLAATAEQAGGMSRAEAYMRAGDQWLLADEPEIAAERFELARRTVVRRSPTWAPLALRDVRAGAPRRGSGPHS